MNKKHEKSSCCHKAVHSWGRRRQRCSGCGKTRVLWKRKRGRKKHRPRFDLLRMYLDHGLGSLTNYALRRHLKPTTLHARLRQTVKRFIAVTPWPSPPPGYLILLADGIHQTFFKSGLVVTFYLLLLRNVSGTSACISFIHVELGKESPSGWWKTLAHLPLDVRKRLVGLVCDGNPGLVIWARKHRLPLQRCHFHLKHRIANYVRTGPLNRSGSLGQEVLRLVDVVLNEINEPQASKALGNLTALKDMVKSNGLRKVLSGFLKHYRDYRTYLYYSELGLPKTNNSCEAVIKLIRNLQSYAGGFRSQKSLHQWIETLCKHRQTITCNGANRQQN